MGWSLCDLGWFHYDIVNSRAGLAQAGARDEVLAHWDYHCHRLMTWPGPGLPWYIAAALWPGPGPNIANLIRHTRITVSPSSSPSPCREQVQCTWPQWRCCFITSTDFPPRRVSILKLNQRVKYFYYQFNYPGPSKHYLWYFWRCMERQGRVLKMNYLWDLWCILWDSRVLQKTFMKNRFAFKIYLFMMLSSMDIIRISGPECFPTQLAWKWEALKVCFDVVLQVSLKFSLLLLHLSTKCALIPPIFT